MIVVPSPIVSLKLFRVIRNSMCICICKYIYIPIYIYVCVYMYIYIYVCIIVYLYIYFILSKACKAYLESIKVLCFSKVFSAHSGQFVGKGATCFGLRAQVSQLSQQTMQPKKQRIDKTSENKH